MATVSYRPADEADVIALAELFNASYRADGIPQVLDARELAEELSSERTSLATDTRVAVDSGAAVGVAYTVYIPSETVHERCFVFGTVAPDRRGEGIGRDLMTWAIDHASGLLRSTERDLPRRIVVDAYEQRTRISGCSRASASGRCAGSRSCAARSATSLRRSRSTACRSSPGRTIGTRSCAPCATPPSPITGERLR